MMTPDMQSSLSGIPTGTRKKTRRGKGGKGTPIGDPKDLHTKMGERIDAGDLHGAKAHAFAMVRTLHALAPKPNEELMPKNWIAGAVKNKGALHRALEVPVGEKIPAGKVATAAKSDDPRLAREARLAQTLKALRKK